VCALQPHSPFRVVLLFLVSEERKKSKKQRTEAALVSSRLDLGRPPKKWWINNWACNWLRKHS
jgi:hypothetical protein